MTDHSFSPFPIPVSPSSDPSASIPPLKAMLSQVRWFKDECKRLDVQNFALSFTLDSLSAEQSLLREEVEELSNPQYRAWKRRQRKRNRRVASDIPRHFVCSQCDKSYGSEGSLNQHARLKHAEDTQRT